MKSLKNKIINQILRGVSVLCSPKSLKILSFIVFIILANTSYGADKSIKEYLGGLKWIISALIGVAALACIAKGAMNFKHGQEGAMTFVITGVVVMIAAGVANMMWESVFGSEHSVEMNSDF